MLSGAMIVAVALAVAGGGFWADELAAKANSVIAANKVFFILMFEFGINRCFIINVF